MDGVVVRADGLTKIFPGGRGVRELDFEARAGEVFGYLGPNGAAKTTTIRLLVDLIRPTSGRLELFGLDPRRRGPAVRARIGYLPGDLRLYERLTARELLEYLARLRGARLPEDARGLADRLELELDRPIRTLSKGNRQKVGLMQAFVHRPELLLLDEPTAGLDPLMQQVFYELVREATGAGRTVFLSSHVLSEVQHVADRVALVRAGRLELVESVETLRSRAYTQVRASFAAAPPPHVFEGLPGVRVLDHAGSVVTFALEGPADPLVKALAGYEVIGLDSHEPTSKTSSSPSSASPAAVLRSVLLKSLRDARRGFAWWCAGLAGLVALMVSVYPTVRDNPDLNRLVQQYPEALKAFISFGGAVDYVSGAGYLGSELFSFMVPLLFLIAAIGNGAGSIAGEEERGTLELLLAQPVRRRRIAGEKLAAMAIEVAALAAVLWLALWIGAAATGLGVSAGHLAAASASAAVLAIAFGAVAFMLGAATGRRVLAIGAATAAAAAAYLVNSLAGLVHGLRPAQKLSPFYHYAASDPLRHGLALDHALVLVAVVVVAAAAGVVAFERRDVATS